MINNFSIQADSSDEIKIKVKLSTKGNNIEFDQKALEVPFGKKIHLVFDNHATADSQIDHNVIILKPGSEESFIADLQTAAYDLIKLKDHKALVAVSETISPGEETTVTFTPKEKGFFPYLCVMPGHGDILGMKGLMHVK